MFGVRLEELSSWLWGWEGFTVPVPPLFLPSFPSPSFIHFIWLEERPDTLFQGWLWNKVQVEEVKGWVTQGLGQALQEVLSRLYSLSQTIVTKQKALVMGGNGLHSCYTLYWAVTLNANEANKWPNSRRKKGKVNLAREEKLRNPTTFKDLSSWNSHSVFKTKIKSQTKVIAPIRVSAR